MRKAFLTIQVEAANTDEIREAIDAALDAVQAIAAEHRCYRYETRGYTLDPGINADCAVCERPA